MKFYRNKKTGFTIVELAIIIVVIGILAGVSVVGYGTWRQSLAKKEVQSDLKQAASALESGKNFNNGYQSYTDGATPDNYKGSPNVQVAFVGAGDGSSYCIEGTSGIYGEITYHMSSGDSDPVEGPCPGGPGGPGGDPGGGTPEDPYEDVIAADNATGYCAFDTPASPDNNHKANYDCGDLDTGNPTLSGVLDNNRCGSEETWAMNQPGAYAGSYSLQLFAPTCGEYYVHYSTSGQQNFANNVDKWTAETWVKFAGSAQNKNIISVENQWGLRTNSSSAFACDHRTNNPSWQVRTVTTSGITAQTGVWYLMTCSYDNGNMKLYVDGVERGSASYAHGYNNTTGATVHLGSYNNDWAGVGRNQLTGWIDDFAFYKGTALTESDAQERFSYAD